MKDSARYLELVLERNESGIMPAQPAYSDYKIGHADHNRPLCSKSGCIFVKSRHLPSVQKKSNKNKSSGRQARSSWPCQDFQPASFSYSWNSLDHRGARRKLTVIKGPSDRAA